jgi:hypothetical protein
LIWPVVLSLIPTFSQREKELSLFPLSLWERKGPAKREGEGTLGRKAPGIGSTLTPTLSQRERE